MKTVLILVLAVILLLLVGGFAYLFLTQRSFSKQWLQPGEIRGSAIVHRGLSYTLNFHQQEKLLSLFNESRLTKTTKVPPAVSSSSIERIVIYRFGDVADLLLTPLAESDSLFLVAGLKEKGIVLDIKHPRILHELLETTFDQ